MRRPAVAAALMGLWLACAASAAGAHAAIESTDPADGAVLAAAPDEVRLAFTEPPDLELTVVDVVDASGAPVPTGPVEAVPGGNREVLVRLDPLADGVYTVTWRTVSRTDGHFTSGAFTFGVGVPAAEVEPTAPETSGGAQRPSVMSVAGKWMVYAGLAILFGAAIAGLVALGPAATRRGWLLTTAWGLAAVGVIAMTLAERTAVAVPLGTLLASDTGGAYVRLGVAVGTTGLATLAVILRSNRITLVILAGAAGAAMLARADGGHAGGTVAAVTVQWLHLAGGGAWIGGLVWLALGLRRGLEPAAVRRFSNLAACGLAVVFVSGVLRSSNELGGYTWWLHPFETDYRTALVVKLGIVAPLVALGALNRFRNVRHFERLGTTPLIRTVGGELALAAAVFAAAGVLTGLPPRGTDVRTPPPDPVEPLVVSGSDFATTTRVRLEITPGTVGPNDFEAEVTDYDTGEPIDARAVRLTFALPDRPDVGSTLDLERVADGAWRTTGTALALSGTWEVTALVEGAAGSVEVALEVVLAPEQQIDVTETPGLPTIYTITVEGGYQLQTYVDPGEPGRINDVHLTAFDPGGAELPLASATIDMLSPHGHTLSPELVRLGPGHFSATLEAPDLTPGTWSFALTATAQDGTAIEGSFEQTFEG